MHGRALDRGELLRRAGLAAGALAVAPRAVLGGPPPLADLERALAGPVLARGEAGYAQARLLYNPRFDAVKPLAVAFPRSAADVAKAIRWARKHGVRLSVRSGGHSYGGYSTGPGLVLSLARLAGVRVGGDETARIGAGARLGDVYERLWASGVTVPAGSCPSVGIAGLALGGGVGFASRKLGLTCDNVAGLTIVTADGSVLECTERENADLFWACRGGGGGSFGVVTGFTMRTSPVASVSTFSIEWPWTSARAVLGAWQDFAPAAPDELFSVLNLRAAAGVAPRVSCAGQLFGTEAKLRSLLAPLTEVGAPVRVRTATRTYIQAVSLFAGAEGRMTFKGKSDYAMRALTPAGIDAVVRGIEARRRVTAPGGGALLLDSYGGAIGRVPADATAFAHRRALFSLQYLATWATGAPAAVSAANLRWVRDFHASMRPHVSGFAYVNYPDPDLAGWRRAYYGSNLRRLVEVKRRYDPDDVLRFPQSVPARL